MWKAVAVLCVLATLAALTGFYFEAGGLEGPSEFVRRAATFPNTSGLFFAAFIAFASISSIVIVFGGRANRNRTSS